mmetsp:Transcript_12172/g.19665  ORF Transcript_12172/g.19665 Transcript_12172/m.19665 type:complete len:159 (-) Transcript_12172:468-944(-)
MQLITYYRRQPFTIPEKLPERLLPLPSKPQFPPSPHVPSPKLNSPRTPDAFPLSFQEQFARQSEEVQKLRIVCQDSLSKMQKELHSKDLEVNELRLEVNELRQVVDRLQKEVVLLQAKENPFSSPLPKSPPAVAQWPPVLQQEGWLEVGNIWESQLTA